MLSEKDGARWPALVGNPALTRGKEFLRREGSSKKKKKERKEAVDSESNICYQAQTGQFCGLYK